MDKAALIQIVRKRSKKMMESAYEIADSSEKCSMLDDAELLNVLARVMNGKSFAKAFGPPGDWGYETEIGKALSASEVE